MKLTIQGQGDVNLTQRDFVAAGGHGTVYSQGDTAFKVYHDVSGMMPVGKIQELAALPVPPFSRPEHLLLDTKGKPAGYTTRFVRDAYILCQLFPRSFRDREGLTHDKAFKLVEFMREGFDVAHRVGILLIDPNEMNFLVDPKFTHITFVDTDSYQTKSYPATAIMESIRDRHMPHPRAFDEGTDWFSFAVTSFQLLVGIHPYKGKHPTFKGFNERMLANVSVFNKDVGVPAVAYPLDVIPKTWRGWYEAVLERGERSAPPGGHVTVAVIRPVVQAVLGSINLVLDELGQYDGTVTGVWACGHRLVVATDKGLWVDDRRVSNWLDTTTVAFSPKMSTPVAVRHPEDTPEMFDCATKTQVTFGLNAQRVVGYDGRVYLKVGDKIMEVVLTDIGPKVVASTRLAASVLPNASLLFPGGVVQNMLGNTFVSLFPQAGQTFQVRIPDLDAYRVIDARYDAGAKGGVLMVVGRTPKGIFDRLVFRFDGMFQTYDVRKVEDIGTPQGLNFVVTDAGMCICMDEDDKLELTSVNMGSSSVKTITDKMLGGDLRLFKRGGQVFMSRGDKVFSMRMR